MYWVLGTINFTLTNPKFIQESDIVRFHKWMETRGWRFSDYPLDPMSTDYSVSHIDGRDSLLRWDTDIAEWERTENIPHHLMQMYTHLGVVSNNTPLPLCETCNHHQDCWQGYEHRKPLDQDNIHWSHVCLPWIGEKYNTFRIVVIGINPYESGGLDFFRVLIPQAKEEMARGKIKVRFNNPTYAGTILWHRIGLYASQTILKFVDEDDPLTFPELSHIDAYDWIAFTNHVKCSPTGDRSQPSRAMWENCHSILKEELRILNPKILFVLGTGDNIFYLRKNVLDENPLFIDETKFVRIFLGKLHGRTVGIINVPHPTAPARGASPQISRDLNTLLFKYAPTLQNVLHLPRPKTL
ncbi:uracil-DNA glycosylase family protein [Brevibacillus marinus]|uniref:uracil-DNA glycosylase family protein n=1 Tax=Brevibacillus marinus TaxID=2496837 RepID=UPI000F82F882|nr:uracil-DNA glycosylase family protein [Brevibacillus marinus]